VAVARAPSICMRVRHDGGGVNNGSSARVWRSGTRSSRHPTTWFFFRNTTLRYKTKRRRRLYTMNRRRRLFLFFYDEVHRPLKNNATYARRNSTRRETTSREFRNSFTRASARGSSTVNKQTRLTNASRCLKNEGIRIDEGKMPRDERDWRRHGSCRQSRTKHGGSHVAINRNLARYSRMRVLFLNRHPSPRQVVRHYFRANLISSWGYKYCVEFSR